MVESKTYRIFLITIIIIYAYSQENYTLVLHSHERGAACLDGSPAGFYYHLGKGENRNKFLLAFNSGGFCHGMTIDQTLESCYYRSFGGLGSTLNYPPFKNFDNNGGISTNETINPVFYDWTKIFIIYCDGSEYTGSRQDPILFKDKQIYFRGYDNVMEHFYVLDKMFDFYNADKIVITGVSAGGLATYFYSNYLIEHTKKAQIYALPDSGLFITDFVSPTAGKSVIQIMGNNLIKLIYDSKDVGFPFPECFKQFEDDQVQCYNPSNLAKYLKAPMFMIESPYDEYSLKIIIVAGCLTNNKQPYSIENCNQTIRDSIEDYRQQTIAAMLKVKNNRANVGLWGPSCVQHGFIETSTFTDANYKIPSVNGPSVSEAISQFLKNPNQAKWYLDQVPWPYNAGCNGLNKKNLSAE